MPNEYGHLSDTEIRAEAVRAAAKLVALNPQGTDSLNLDHPLQGHPPLLSEILDAAEAVRPNPPPEPDPYAGIRMGVEAVRQLNDQDPLPADPEPSMATTTHTLEDGRKVTRVPLRGGHDADGKPLEAWAVSPLPSGEWDAVQENRRTALLAAATLLQGGKHNVTDTVAAARRLETYLEGS